MARKLTEKQKQMLDELIKQYPKTFHVGDLPKEKINEIANINDNEFIWQQMDQYIMEQWFERVYG